MGCLGFWVGFGCGFGWCVVLVTLILIILLQGFRLWCFVVLWVVGFGFGFCFECLFGFCCTLVGWLFWVCLGGCFGV